MNEIKKIEQIAFNLIKEQTLKAKPDQTNTTTQKPPTYRELERKKELKTISQRAYLIARK